MAKPIYLLVALVVAACGGAGSDFTPAPPPVDPCGLLTVADAQMIVPDAQAGVLDPGPPDGPDFWSRDCAWHSASTGDSVDLVLFGALSENGLVGIEAAAASGDVNTPVTGLGDEAHYWQDTPQGTNGVWALSGSVSVDVTAYFVTPFPTADQIRPLVAKGLAAF